MTKLEVGQRLWYVPRERGQPHEVTVGKVGLHIDGGEYSSPGRCYLSREEWEVEDATRRAWNGLRVEVTNRPPAPEGVSPEAIREAAALLRLPIDQPGG